MLFWNFWNGKEKRIIVERWLCPICNLKTIYAKYDFFPIVKFYRGKSAIVWKESRSFYKPVRIYHHGIYDRWFLLESSRIQISSTAVDNRRFSLYRTFSFLNPDLRLFVSASCFLSFPPNWKNILYPR